MVKIINHYGDNQNEFQPFAGPGQWNDPDMVRVFNMECADYDKSYFGQFLEYVCVFIHMGVYMHVCVFCM